AARGPGHREPPRQLRRRQSALRDRLTRAFLTRSRDEWAEVFADVDACVTPVLAPGEVPHHPHLADRSTLTEIDGVLQASPAPRFSRTAPQQPAPPPTPGQDTDAVLADWKA
ncbi:CoA transferase, partial [Streptomyces sp. NPDC005921]